MFAAAAATLGALRGVTVASAASSAEATVTATTVDNSGGLFEASLTTSHNHPSDSNLLLAFVGVSKASAGAFTSVSATYGGQAMTLVDQTGSDAVGGADSRTEEHLFQLFDPPTGANNLVVSTTPDSRTTVRIYSLNNAVELGTPAKDVISGSALTSIDLSVPSADGDLVLRGTHWRNSAATISFPAAQTGVDDQGVEGQNSRAAASWKRATDGPTAMPATVTASTDNVYALVGVAVSNSASAVSQNYDASSSTITHSWTAEVLTGNSFIVGIGNDEARDVHAVTWTPDSTGVAERLTLNGRQPAEGNARAALAYRHNLTADTGTVEITMSGAARISAYTRNEPNITGVPVDITHWTGTALATSTGATSVLIDDFIIDVITTEPASGASLDATGAQQTEIRDVETPVLLFGGSVGTASADGTVGFDWDILDAGSARRIAHLVVAFTKAAALNATHANQGTLTDTTTSLSVGGDTRYDFSGTTWDFTTDNGAFAVKFGAVHSKGASFYGTVTNGYEHGLLELRSYPTNHAGQYFFRDEEVTDYAALGMRLHHCWDPIRFGFKSGVSNINNVTIRQCWMSNTFDDAVENDNHRDGVLVDDCLMEVTYVPFADRNDNGTDFSARILTVRNSLIGIEQIYSSTPDSSPLVNMFFKLHFSGNSISFDLFDSIWYSDEPSGPHDGDPFYELKNYNNLNQSSGNVLVIGPGWSGSYPHTLPTGFTLETDDQVWIDAVARWKANHPDIPRVGYAGEE